MPYCRNCGTELSEGASYCPKCGKSVEAETGSGLAYWGERFVAWLIDMVILGVILALVRLSLGSAWLGFAWGPDFLEWVPFVDFGLSNVVYFLYWMFMEGLYGQSFGKMIMRLQVTRLDGEPANMVQAVIESVGKAFLLPIDCIVGWILYTKNRQRLFNYLSETIVMKAQR